MTADIGTRKRAKVADVLENSTWMNGENWPKHDKAQFPTKSFHDIRLSQKELKGHNDEIMKSDVLDNGFFLRIFFLEE